MTQQSGPVEPARATIDVGAVEAVASSLLPVAGDLRQLASDLLRHAPDPGLPPAPDALVAVQTGALDALSALADGLEETSQLLVMTARRYRGTEEEVARTLRRLAGDGP